MAEAAEAVEETAAPAEEVTTTEETAAPASGIPDTWREDFAAGDEAKLQRLSRYASPTAVVDGLIAAQQKISSGEFKQVTPFPAEGTDEAKAEWRANNGIPEAADKYGLEYEDADDFDKTALSNLAATALERNMTPDQAKTAADWYFDMQDLQREERLNQDKTEQQASEDSLRAEWGDDYRGNVNRIQGLLDTAPEGVKEKLLGARFDDGTALGNDPDALKFLIDMALQINPATTLVPGAGDNIHGAISDELDTLKGMMGHKNSDYWKGPKAEKLQARYRELMTAQERIKK